MVFKCGVLIYYKNSRGRSYWCQARLLTLVEYVLLLYRALIAGPDWYRFFLNKNYGNLLSSLTTGLYLTFKLISNLEKAAGEHSGGSLKGIAFLLHADFLNNPEATYRIADSIAKSEDEAITSELRSFLLEEWSEEAFLKGRLLAKLTT